MVMVASFFDFVHADGGSAHDARPAHAAGNHCRVTGQAADRRQNALGNVHAVNVVRSRLFADQNYWTLRRQFNGIF